MPLRRPEDSPAATVKKCTESFSLSVRFDRIERRGMYSVDLAERAHGKHPFVTANGKPLNASSAKPMNRNSFEGVGLPPGGFANTADAKKAEKATSPRSILTGISQ